MCMNTTNLTSCHCTSTPGFMCWPADPLHPTRQYPSPAQLREAWHSTPAECAAMHAARGQPTPTPIRGECYLPEACDAHMTTIELHWNCRGVDMPVVKVRVPSDDGARAVWAFLKVKGSRLGLEIPSSAKFTIRFECSTGEGAAYVTFRADPPSQHLKEIIEGGNWKGALTGQGLGEDEVVKLFVVEGRPLEEDEEMEVEENGDNCIREYNQVMEELEEAEEIVATWPSVRSSYYAWLDGARW